MVKSDFIDLLKKSKNKLLSKYANNVEQWGKLVRNKKNIELLLKYNIVELVYNKKVYWVTSNITCLNYINSQRREKDKNSVVKIITRSPNYNKILNSKDPTKIRTWDIERNDKLDIYIDKLGDIGLIFTATDLEVLQETTYVLQKDNKNTKK